MEIAYSISMKHFLILLGGLRAFRLWGFIIFVIVRIGHCRSHSESLRERGALLL